MGIFEILADKKPLIVPGEVRHSGRLEAWPCKAKRPQTRMNSGICPENWEKRDGFMPQFGDTLPTPAHTLLVPGSASADSNCCGWSGGVLSVSASVALTLFLFYKVRLRLQMRSQQLVRREPFGLLRVELRRCAELRAHADGLGGLSFPSPVETRTRSLVFCQLPLWTRCESIGLPCGAEARFDQLAAADYDQHFSVDFQARQRGHTASRLHAPA